MHTTRTATLAIACCLGVLATTPSSAGPTSIWTVDSYQDFDKGKAKSTLISSKGEVRAGFAATAIEVGYSASWSMIAGTAGELFIGTSDSGTIYRLKAGKLSKLASLAGVAAVVSLVQGPGGSLYAGTMPDGQVWRVSLDGKSKKLASLKGAESVWSLAVAKDGGLYAGTGPEGQLFRLDRKSGKTTMAFDSKDKRITALMAAKDGSIWLGTSEKGLIYRHDPARKATRAIADFAGNEISAIAEWNGAAVVAANDLKEPSTSGIKTKTAVDKAKKKDKGGVAAKTPKAGTKPGADAVTPMGAAPPRKGARKGKGALYRVRGDGQLTQLHALSSTYFTSVSVTEDGSIYAGAGDKGKIYLVEGDDSVSTVFDVDQRVIAQMAYVRGAGLYFTTADSTALYKTAGAAKKGEYLSDTFNAKASARFGTITWRGQNANIDTRSGNTAEPGLGWSKWQRPAKVRRAAVGMQRGKVASPPGRYLQYRVRFANPKGVVSETKVFYLAHNRPTTVESIEVKLPERKTKKLLTIQAKPKARSPLIELSWKVENSDDDETVYELGVRRDGEVRWRSLVSGDKPITTTTYKWNTETFPDGHYRLRITASDRLANPQEQRRETHKTTGFFVVDNQKPKIDGLSVRYPAASARASDSLSTIAEAAFSVDDGSWTVVGANDGLFDDQAELLNMVLPKDLTPGLHTLALRVADESGNVGSASISFRVQ